MSEVSGGTKLAGILGFPVGHSWSPAIQNAAFQACGLDILYLPFAVPPERLAEAVTGLKALGAVGFNVTIPHKERIMDFLDRVDPAAAAIGAVNTVRNEGGKWCGFNTDGHGFLRSLEAQGFNPRGRAALLLGAGGASRAVAVSLGLAGAARIYLANRSPGRAEAIARAVQRTSSAGTAACGLSPAELKPLLAETDLVVQATPVGMHPGEGVLPPLDPSWLRPGALVVDLIYNPPRTAFLEAAAAAGCPTVGGLEMLLYQGAEAFRLWTGREAPLGEMRAALERCAAAAGGKA